jgi:hypothetical protein
MLEWLVESPWLKLPQYLRLLHHVARVLGIRLALCWSADPSRGIMTTMTYAHVGNDRSDSV